MKRSLKTKITTILLSLAMFLTLMPITTNTISADDVKTTKIMLNADGTASNLIGAQNSSIYFGNYKQSSNGSGSYYNDPIKWRVLSNAKNSETNKQELFLLSDMVLDCKVYQTSRIDTTWETSYMRSWLNNTNADDSFINLAFNHSEQSYIIQSEVINNNNPEYDTDGGKDTKDKLFLLSIDEVDDIEDVNGEVDASAYGFTNYTSRKAKATYYAKEQGNYDVTYYIYIDYWLRSPGSAESVAAYVDDHGYTNEEAADSLYGVRPAFKIDVASILFTSDVNGGKAQSSLGLNEISETDTNEWKLTLLDTTRGFSVTQTNPQTDPYKPNDVLKFEYETTNTSTNDYISAILADDNGNVFYYGRLLKPSSDTGDLEVTIPSNIFEGNYKLHLFSEQYNGGDNDDNKQVDYASSFSTISLTVERDTPVTHEVTYIIVNGTLSDGTSTTVTETVNHGSSPTQIPTGMIADENYEDGEWDIDPLNATITTNTAFRYIFARKKIRSIHINDESASNLKGAQEDSIYFGNYYQSSGEFKEPIKWRILENDSTTLFLLSDQNLDVKKYQDSGQATTSWEKCTLRQWLNGIGDYTQDSFIKNAFNSDEQAIITETTVINDENPTYFTPGGNDTQDKLFLLSYKEVLETKYGFVNNSEATQTRVATNTKYAADRSYGTSPEGKANHWWLRSPGHTLSNMLFVDNNGRYNFIGTHGHDTNTAVRPAFKIDVASILFTSDVNGGKAQSSLGLNEVSRVYTNEWKLTLLDTTRGFSATHTNPQTGPYKPDDVLTFEYENATIGNNEYISAILIDNSGDALYYGRLLKPSSDTGDLEITIPSNLSTGSYKIHVFSEQYNGEDNDTTKSTDYASNFSTTSFEVNAPSHQVTYKVVNGAFDDGSTSTTEIVEHGKTPSSIPTNLKPKQGYEAGSWNPDPTNATITEPTVFTYTFTKIPVKEIQLNIDKKASNLIGAQESSIYFGNYYQDNTSNKQPIKWRVLSNEENPKTEKQELFLLSDMVLDSKPYHNEWKNITWKDGSIRLWLNQNDSSTDSDARPGLNDGFLGSAFSDDEQEAILISNVINDKNPQYGTDAGDNTEDKIFLLSIDEVLKLNIENEVDEEKYGFTDNASRQAKPTAYTLSKGVNNRNNYADYWLRSPGDYQFDAAFVYVNGDVDILGADVVDGDIGARPAFKINLESVLFTSSAEGSKAQSSLGLKEVSDATTTDWKLTLLDDTRKFVATQTGTTKDTYEAGDTLSFTYKEAKTGDNEYISAIITDDKDNVLYYGRLLQLTDTTDTSEPLDVTLPNLEDGNYKLRIFNEQYNGGDNDVNLTDYASKFSTIEFTIEQAPVTQYTIKFVDEDGTELQSSDWDEGSTPVYSGPTPTKSPDAQYTYRFIGWTPVIAKVTGDATYKATYASTLREYTVTFVNDDGTELQSSQVNYGDMPYYTGATPTKQADAQYTYTFDKWTPDITAVTGTATYTATYKATPIPVTVTYNTTAGDNSSWTKGDTKTLDFTFKRSEDDQDTYEKHFIGIEVDDKKVDKSKYESKSGSVIVMLKSEYLESIGVGKHTIKAIFDDGSSTANFTIKEKGNNNNNNNNNKTYYIPKTGVE